MRLLIYILLFFCFSARLQAFVVSDSNAVDYSEQIKKKFVLPDPIKEKAIFDKKEYQYKDIKKVKQGEDFWAKLIRLINRLFAGMDRPNGNKSSGNVFKWIFLVAIIVLATFLLIKSKFIHLLMGNKRVNQAAFEAEEIHLSEARIEDLILKAEQNNDYKNAIRYQLLKMLKYLSASNQIYLESYKTNIDFIHEIKRKEVKLAYIRIANAYDLVWYGERNLAPSEYDSIKEVIQNFSYTSKNG